MELREKLNTKGYAIFSIENLKIFEKLKDSVIQKIFNETGKDINLLRKKMAKMSNVEINDSMINLLSLSGASEMMISSCQNVVEMLCGKELFIQRRANTIFNLPGKDQRRQWPHYEMMSGISPFTYVLWAPFHDLDDDGGVYYYDKKKSYEIMKKEHSKGIVNGPDILNMKHNEKPIKLNYGEAIIFNPFILHGNTAFKSDLARIACSIRFQSIKKPLMQRNSDFLKYYKIN
tara:strand:- start:694 stop:1389 length:696 start_codon:yes stop_codon:yes gene_type:complete